jgi:hypothetical protein
METGNIAEWCGPTIVHVTIQPGRHPQAEMWKKTDDFLIFESVYESTRKRTGGALGVIGLHRFYK